MWVKVGGKFAAFCILDSLKERLLSTLEEVHGRQRKKVQPWVTNKVMDLGDQRRQLKQHKYTSTEAELEYRKVNREVRKKMKAEKEAWIEKQCKNIEGSDVRKQQRGQQHHQGSHQDPTA